MSTEQSKEEIEFLEEMKSLGLEVVTEKEVEGLFGLAIEVDLDTEVDYTHLIEQKDFILKKLTGRKDFFYIRLKSYNKEKKTLTLLVATPISEMLANFYGAAILELPSPIGTNFPDFCWYHAEGTTEATDMEVETNFREEAIMDDLTNFIPVRMSDNFIEIMHTLNRSFLQGLMQDTICYGPFLMK